jgi:hypothetical protein
MTSRRKFLKTLGLVAGAAILPIPTFSNIFIESNASAFNPNGQFSLEEIKRLLSTYTMPPANNFSFEAYTLKYNLYNVYWNVDNLAGTFTLEKSNTEEGKQFDFLKDTKSNSMRHFLSGSVKTLNNEYTTPLYWECYSRIAAKESDPGYLYSDLRYSGESSRDMLKIVRGKERPVNIAGRNLSWKWGHLNMAQMMSKQGLVSLTFDMLDEMDLLLPNITMKLFAKVDMPVGEKNITFSVYDMKGHGTLPWVTWVDDKHRAIFSLSCQEAYLLNESASISVDNTRILQDSISIYPNPVRDMLYIKGISNNNAMSKITNTKGQIMANLTISQGESINVALLPKGIYFITIEYQGIRVVKQFIKA